MIGVASPHLDDGVEERLAACFREADVIGPSCLGYNGSLADAAERATGKPVVLARRPLAAAVGRAVAQA